uniref:Pro-corazonin n=1 Tax=Daphnia pulex TaxID=6669 RepID=D8KXX3_DAPPU|nr:corazonin preprohormone [Daphnia pulex]
MFINQYVRYSSSIAMAVRLYFVLLLVVVSAMAQTFQYSRGWTNGRKRSDPSFVQQQQWIQRNGHPIVVPAEFRSNSFEDWSRYRINSEKVFLIVCSCVTFSKRDFMLISVGCHDDNR